MNLALAANGATASSASQVNGNYPASSTNTHPDWLQICLQQHHRVEAYGPTETRAFGGVRWLVPDHLGTPRIIVDQSGSLAGIKRHDYLPFGEELFVGTGGRTVEMGYAGDGVRQQFTQYERDNETGLDFAQARYYGSTQGRFTSTDPYNIVMETKFATDAKKAQSQVSAYLNNPQRWARYTYALNNPLLYTDPQGEDVTIYYRPPDPNQKKDYGHIFIYVRNDDTGESAYFDYIADGWPATVTILNGVDQQRIDNHASLTIETRPDQEQAILNGIKDMQQSAPDYSLSKTDLLKHTESTCTSNSIDLLKKGGINVGPIIPIPQTPSITWEIAFEKFGDKVRNVVRVEYPAGIPTPRFPPRTIMRAVVPGREYGHDSRGQARRLDPSAVNNKTLEFRGGKRGN